MTDRRTQITFRALVQFWFPLIASVCSLIFWITSMVGDVKYTIKDIERLYSGLEDLKKTSDEQSKVLYEIRGIVTTILKGKK